MSVSGVPSASLGAPIGGTVISVGRQENAAIQAQGQREQAGCAGREIGAEQEEIQMGPWSDLKSDGPER